MTATRNDIETQQLQSLRHLLSTCLKSNDFYAPKIKQANPTSLSDFKKNMPLTTKAQLVADQSENPPYGTNLTEPLSHYTRFSQTSGTTGNPLHWLDTPQSWQSMIGCWKQIFQVAQVTQQDRCLFPFSFGPFIGFWLAFESASQLGCLTFPAGGLSSAARLKMILDNHITVICCTPTYAIRLAQVAQSENINLKKANVKTLIVAGEPGGSIPATRNHIESLWPGAKVFDHHGMTEVGPVTYACPQNPTTLHVLENAYLAEIIDPQTLEPLPPSQTGELILTTLTRTASPLLRYRTGDLVQAAQNSPCTCGRHELALQGAIQSRTDDMIIIRGVNIFPSAIESVLRSMPNLAEYQVTIDKNNSLPELKIKAELTSSTDNPKQWSQKLENELQTAFSLRIPITIVEPDTLPRFEMKAKRWTYL